MSVRLSELARLGPPFGAPVYVFGDGAAALWVTAAGSLVQHLVPVETLPGVVVVQAAARNGPGTGYLCSLGDGREIAWRAPGSDRWGEAVDCTAGGTAVLRDGNDPDKWVRVAVFPIYLLPAPNQARVLLGDRYENAVGHDDVTAAEAAAGDLTAYELTLENRNTAGLGNVRAWLDPSVAGLELSVDGGGYSTPTTEETALELADIPPGESITLYLRRAIGVAAVSDPDIVNLLHLSFSTV